tara:strand:- start:269 stop:532 length:264 start_codon:yes stop_codon:yes gene_type:complete
MSIRDILIISSVILIPSWTVAYVTEQVIYVIPMLAVCTFIVAQLFSNQSKRIEDDGMTIIKGKGKGSNVIKGKGNQEIMDSHITGDH